MAANGAVEGGEPAAVETKTAVHGGTGIGRTRGRRRWKEGRKGYKFWMVTAAESRRSTAAEAKRAAAGVFAGFWGKSEF